MRLLITFTHGILNILRKTTFISDQILSELGDASTCIVLDDSNFNTLALLFLFIFSQAIACDERSMIKSVIPDRYFMITSLVVQITLKYIEMYQIIKILVNIRMS